MAHVCLVSLNALPLFDDSDRGAFGGAEVRAATFARGLASRARHEVSFVVRSKVPCEPRVCQGITLRFDQSFLPRVHPRATMLAQVKQQIRLRQPSVHWLWQLPILAGDHLRWKLQVAGDFRPRVLPFYRDLPASIVGYFGVDNYAASVFHSCHSARRPTILFIASDHNLAPHKPHSRELGPYREISGLCYETIRLASTIVVQSQVQLDLLKRNFGREGVLIRNPIDLTVTAQPRADLQGCVLWIGRAESIQKQPELAFELARRLPDMRMVMVANSIQPGQYEQLLAAKPANVTLLDRVPFGEVESLYASAAVYLNTSRFEGFPNAFLQAAKHRVPIASLNVDPEGMLTTHGGGWCASGNLDHLADALRIACSNSAEALQRGQAAHAYVQRFHSLDGRLQELEAVIDHTLSLAGKQGGPRP